MVFRICFAGLALVATCAAAQVSGAWRYIATSDDGARVSIDDASVIRTGEGYIRARIHYSKTANASASLNVLDFDCSQLRIKIVTSDRLDSRGRSTSHIDMPKDKPMWIGMRGSNALMPIMTPKSSGALAMNDVCKF